MSICESELLLEARVPGDYVTLCAWEDQLRKVTEHYDVVSSSSFKVLKNDLLKRIKVNDVEFQKIYWLPVSHFCLLSDEGNIQLFRQMDGAPSTFFVNFESRFEDPVEEEEQDVFEIGEGCNKKQKTCQETQGF